MNTSAWPKGLAQAIERGNAWAFATASTVAVLLVAIGFWTPVAIVLASPVWVSWKAYLALIPEKIGYGAFHRMAELLNERSEKEFQWSKLPPSYFRIGLLPIPKSIAWYWIWELSGALSAAVISWYFLPEEMNVVVPLSFLLIGAVSVGTKAAFWIFSRAYSLCWGMTEAVYVRRVKNYVQSIGKEKLEEVWRIAASEGLTRWFDRNSVRTPAKAGVFIFPHDLRNAVFSLQFLAFAECAASSGARIETFFNRLNMERRELIAEEVHSYYFDRTKIDVERVRAALCGTPTVASPPIPAFEIPEELRVNGLRYAIPDGNHRWLIGYVTSGRVAAIVYGSTERLDVEAHGLAPFRNADSPGLYERTIAVYCLQMGILGRMRELFASNKELLHIP